MFSAGETVTVIRPAVRDRLGDTDGSSSEHSIDGCAINQTGSAAENDRRNTILTRIELMCPTGADLRAGDKVRLPNGAVYDVEGIPWRSRSPFTGWGPGMTAMLRGVSDAP
ncbi:hypothetical protein [Nocardia sp. NPDC051463]|uniref:hypothetical protein n=1 Tax=Nocardia sp. NPDC051463 TaxID=3154845 RepID=UPI00344C7F66